MAQPGHAVCPASEPGSWSSRHWPAGGEEGEEVWAEGAPQGQGASQRPGQTLDHHSEVRTHWEVHLAATLGARGRAKQCSHSRRWAISLPNTHVPAGPAIPRLCVHPKPKTHVHTETYTRILLQLYLQQPNTGNNPKPPAGAWPPVQGDPPQP